MNDKCMNYFKKKSIVEVKWQMRPSKMWRFAQHLSLVVWLLDNTLTNLSRMKYLSLQKKFNACKNFKYTVANSKFLTKQTNVIKVMLPVLPKSILSVYIYLLLIL